MIRWIIVFHQDYKYGRIHEHDHVMLLFVHKVLEASGVSWSVKSAVRLAA